MAQPQHPPTCSLLGNQPIAEHLSYQHQGGRHTKSQFMSFHRWHFHPEITPQHLGCPLVHRPCPVIRKLSIPVGKPLLPFKDYRLKDFHTVFERDVGMNYSFMVCVCQIMSQEIKADSMFSIYFLLLVKFYLEIESLNSLKKKKKHHWNNHTIYIFTCRKTLLGLL